MRFSTIMLYSYSYRLFSAEYQYNLQIEFSARIVFARRNSFWYNFHMKIWIKYLLGVILGFIASFAFPASSPQTLSTVSFIAEIFLRLGFYILIPLLTSSVIISAFNLSDSKMLLKSAFWTAIIITGSSLLLTFIGLFSVIFIKLPRIPITVEKLSSVTVLDISELIRKAFPASSLSSLSDGLFLLPVFIFSLVIGIACSYDRSVSRQIVSLADSFSRVCYLVMIFFMEIFSIGIIAVTISWAIQFRSVIAQGIFTPLILILSGNLLFVSLIVYPAILYFLCHDPHPYRVLYASIAALLTAFFSGNTNITLPLIIRHGKESLGEQRRINAFSAPLFSIFARGGSSLVTIVSFILIWRSYSSLSIGFFDLLWLTSLSFLLSFVLGNMPTGGTFFALTVLGAMYGRGFETGHLLLKPAAVIIGSFAAAFDAITAMFGTYIIAIKTKQIHHKELSSFI